MIDLFLKLLLAHVLGDFVLQSENWVIDKMAKKHRSKYLYMHLLVHLSLLFVILQFNIYYWMGIILIVISHGLIDLAKLHAQAFIDARLNFFLDQFAHIGILVLVTSMYVPVELSWNWIFQPQTMLFLVALVCVSFVSSIIMKVFIGAWKIEEEHESDSLKNAGKYIGILERILVFGFIVLNQWASIGLLIAAKSVLRFNDLTRSKDRKLTEYILIGTLLSFSLALLFSLLYFYFLKQLN